MRDQYDIPDMPEKWHSLLLNTVLIFAHEYIYEFERAAFLRGVVEKEIKELKASETHKRAYAPVIGRSISTPLFPRLPSNYPLG